ncbi:L-aminopeptidase/D-esterase-like protein [Nocardia transvalensis]|uniref:L-aminopeptidase/D-esterase-like protein n=1 Tax=Nocardia transvalensis TaxID=37333 RepID=A0A7W9UKY4_9NOCA|nr:P1 family peptidase [Nocardia transvalensis]MBB5916966.1 L-aminopeptidase/D-esterase-like protein [Nocardia transvalensis]
MIEGRSASGESEVGVEFGISGVRVGHWTDTAGQTGCTVLELPEGSVASCEVRGGAPASRELDALSPDKSVVSVDAIVLTGGSAFGLAAADGVMRYLEEQGRGVPTPAGRVPIAPTLALFDLAAGDATARPTADSGYAAAQAVSGEQVLAGRIGAGTGAYTSHWRGEGRRPGGLAFAQRRLGDLVVGALCVVNAFGDIDHGDTEVPLDAVAILNQPFEFAEGRTHTTIGAVVTNARLDKPSCHIVAQGAHDGLSRALTPPHTRFDGDGFIAAATGEVDTHVDVVRLMALAAVTDAIRSVDR